VVNNLLERPSPLLAAVSQGAVKGEERSLVKATIRPQIGGELESIMSAAPAKIEGWTTAQAAYILGEDPSAFTKTVDKSPVTPTHVQRGKAKVRYFLLPDLVYLHARPELTAFTPKTRAEIYDVLKGSDMSKLRGNTPELRGLNVRNHLASVRRRLKDLEHLEGKIDTSQTPPVIRGTTIEAYRIAALLDGGMPVAEVLEDYPSLTKEQVLAAKAYAEATPKLGRPYPRRTAKAAMRSVDLSLLDAYMDARE
jgi:uncharacterized protein (DUF433 family)